MNTNERIKMVKAMEFICRQINDEDVFMPWLTDGVADGDIDYGDFDIKLNDEAILDYYISEEHFGELMDTFLHCMSQAKKSGGLFCDNVVSDKRRYK